MPVRAPDCVAGKRRAGPVVIHVIAEHSTLGGGQVPGVEVGAQGLIPPELIAELAASATLVPLVHPVDPCPSRTMRRRRRWLISCGAGITPAAGRDVIVRPPSAMWTIRSLRRRRADARIQPQMLLPNSPPGENVLGLAGETITRRHLDPDLTGRTHLRHHAR